ncbi:uncharacterized protein EV422DRAFT_540066 [Fimicolochytrium jonesii]|uniref:uncharacterized protein n=1 Tax=Fimicolochytrium jonesii TaxID=1396493 RepID=UPI0022FE4DA9|nr:uncharacterized protein EV422DRAFT_540066 [Fimicolochytrium jonesii]KAI8817817.1 hypothetical protein EV422DRAFT_540066 [Fimicolochytrium jonesii]
MSSGFGTSGGRGRCFPFWQEFARCYVQADTDPKTECRKGFEDYQECLYHRKELLRMTLVQEEYIKTRQSEEQQKAAAAAGAGKA